MHQTLPSREIFETVPEFYAGQKILVTGGTGFMGKVLVEKILRSCPDVDSIYLIMREKKGKSIEQRWKDITELPLFEKLKAERPENLKKVKLIPGDLGKNNFGVSSINLQELKENITIIFHAAADVQFSVSINDALLENVKGVKAMLDLAKSMEHLKVFVHISTAYSNHNKPPSEAIEKILPPCQDWKVLLKLQENEPKPLQQLKEKLLCGHPNPYTWSKSLAEQVVNEYSIHFPVVVMRPSVVVGTILEDPILAWADTLGAYSATALGIVLGIVRIFKSRSDSYNDHIPVDIATRAELIATKKAVETNDRVSVYNAGTSNQMAFTNGKVFEAAKNVEEKYMVKEKVWPSDVWFIDNKYLYIILLLYRQVIPSIFLDILLKLFGQKPMFLKISIKLANGYKLISRFANVKITFPTDNFKSLEGYLNEKDKEQFSIDISDILNEVDNVVENMNKGLLMYILKADLSNEAQEKLRPRYQKIKILRNIFRTIEYSTLGYFAWRSLLYLINRLNLI